MKLRVFLLCFIISVSFGVLQAETASNLPVLSTESRISLITQWPGSEIYLAFGHSAIRVKDDSLGIDHLFNYGTFTLDDPLIIAKFVRGELNYLLSVRQFQPDLNWDNKYEQRIWHEQILDLDSSQKNRLFAFLANNARPENRTYLYDFVLDNCSTRISAALEKVLGDEIKFDPLGAQPERKTFRHMIDESVNGRPFYQFMFYLVLGTAVDRKVTAFEEMWSPSYLMNDFNKAKLVHDGKERPLVISQARVNDPTNPPSWDSPLLNPAFILWPLFAIVAFFTARSMFGLRRGRSWPVPRLPFRIADFLLFFILGLMGVMVTYLTFFADHSVTKGNFNVIWLLPTHLIAAFFIVKKHAPMWSRWYFALTTVAVLVPLLAWPIWPQAMHPTMIPLMLIIALRSINFFMRTGGLKGSQS